VSPRGSAAFCSTEPLSLRASYLYLWPTDQLINRSTNVAPLVRPLSPCHHAHVSPRPRLRRSRSDQTRFFGYRINLVFQEVRLGLQLRDLLQQCGVLGDELLEEGEDLFVGNVIVHECDEWCVRSSHPDAGTPAKERRGFIPGGKGSGPMADFFKRENSRGSA
jgi:hypothetical protein